MEEKIKIVGARVHNLKNIDLEIPRNALVVITGLSGSGKSSLVNEILNKHLASELNNAKRFAGKHDRIEGTEHLDKVINIDQSPIGRTPRSNPATYTGVFTDIRELFAFLNKMFHRLFTFVDLRGLVFLCRKVGFNCRFQHICRYFCRFD